MFLLSLEVQNFRVLREAHLTFGRGLNVLFGPNDLGKSSLAEALRVAFLLPVTSNKWHELVPWGTDFVPRVVVTFEMNNVVWQITKTFGSGARGTSLLERVDEGRSLREEAKGRAVEEKLREIIAWGVPAPGGKGAPKGLPESYLATALLGRQDAVTAILEASPEEDGDNSGLGLVTKALGALGQDPLVSRLLQRLQERTEKVFTEGGQLRRGLDSPLVQLTNKVKDQKERLDKLEESVRQSGEIEKKVQCLTEHRILAAEECSLLERRVELLRKVRKAEEELERVRHREQSMEEAQRALAVIEKDLRETESRHEQANSALLSVEKDLQTARERQVRAEGSQEKVRENAQQTREARRTELIAKRDAAARQVQAAQGVIVRDGEWAQAEAEFQRAQQAELCAQNLAELASLLAEQQRANTVVETLNVASRERDDRVKRMTKAEAELQQAEAALEYAERAAKSQTDALATAQREAAQRNLRTETLRTSLIRGETAEREALQVAARANAAMACSARLGEAEQSLADSEANERTLENKLTANGDQKQACEERLRASMPLPIQAALLVGLLGGAITAALGTGLQFPGVVLAVSIVGSSLLAAVVAAFVLRHRKLRGATQVLLQQIDALAKAREKLLEMRNQALARRGAAQVRVDSARSERDQAMATVGALDVAVPKACSRLQEARREQESIRRELAILQGHQPKHDAISCAQVEAANRAVVLLEEQVPEKRRMRDEARHQRAEAQVRFEAATSSAASVDLAGLEQRVNAARMKARGEVAPDPEEAQAQLQIARRKSVNLETAMKVARGRRSDAQSSFEGMADALGQPANRVLAEAEKKREDADKALEGLEETSSAEVAAAEKEFLEAQADIVRLGKEQVTARTEAEAVTKARDQNRTKRDQAQAKFEALFSSVPNANLTDAKEALAQACREFESDPDGSTSLPKNLAAVEGLLKQQQADLRRTENELQEARGQLKFVSGTVARDQRDQEFEALQRLKKSAEDLELEYRATKRLLDVLMETEVKHAAHLGRSLAKPVTEIFSEFTSGRYEQIVLDSGLRFRSVMAKGGERELTSLSVGTRDQLATLVRLALAAHLKCVLVLDDQLIQSDPHRLVWFQDRLRTTVRDHNHQIIVITCRPLDYLQPEDMPVPPCDRLETEDGKLAVLDLERLTSCA